MLECERLQLSQERVLDGAAAPLERAEVHAHHAHCDACRTYVAKVHQLEAQDEAPRSDLMSKLGAWARRRESFRRAALLALGAVGISAALAATGVDLGTGAAPWELLAAVAWNAGLGLLAIRWASRRNSRALLAQL